MRCAGGCRPRRSCGVRERSNCLLTRPRHYLIPPSACRNPPAPRRPSQTTHIHTMQKLSNVSRLDLVDSHGRWKGPCLQTDPHEVANRTVGVSLGWEVAHEAVLRRPPNFPRHDCSPYSYVHVRRESLEYVHHSRAVLCRPVPNPLRNDSHFYPIAGRAVRRRRLLPSPP